MGTETKTKKIDQQCTSKKSNTKGNSVDTFNF